MGRSTVVAISDSADYLVTRGYYPACRIGFIAVLVLVVLTPSSHGVEHDPDLELSAADRSFIENVLPVLRDHCFECHSHEAGEASGGLVLDSRRGWVVGGDSGTAVVPGMPGKSRLVRAIRYDSELEMPPDGRLPAEIIHKIEKWVAAGAHDPRVSIGAQIPAMADTDSRQSHWAFQARRAVTAPEVTQIGWPENDIDRFILAELHAVNLDPVADADPFTWLR